MGWYWEGIVYKNGNKSGIKIIDQSDYFEIEYTFSIDESINDFEYSQCLGKYDPFRIYEFIHNIKTMFPFLESFQNIFDEVIKYCLGEYFETYGDDTIWLITYDRNVIKCFKNEQSLIIYTDDPLKRNGSFHIRHDDFNIDSIKSFLRDRISNSDEILEFFQKSYNFKNKS